MVVKSGLKQIESGVYEGVKTFSIDNFKSTEDSGKFYLSGYANTKNKPDSYGDVPTNFNGQPIYDLSRILKNPVMLADHRNSVENIMGNFVELKEDSVGLYFKALLVPIDAAYSDVVKHAVSMFRNGFARALSIGGRWFFDDPKNPTHLTRAYLMEISGVAIPADEDALCNNTIKPKNLDLLAAKRTDQEVLRRRKLFLAASLKG